MGGRSERVKSLVLGSRWSLRKPSVVDGSDYCGRLTLIQEKVLAQYSPPLAVC